jgi:hypothetical protein
MCSLILAELHQKFDKTILQGKIRKNPPFLESQNENLCVDYSASIELEIDLMIMFNYNYRFKHFLTSESQFCKHHKSLT